MCTPLFGMCIYSASFHVEGGSQGESPRRSPTLQSPPAGQNKCDLTVNDMIKQDALSRPVEILFPCYTAARPLTSWALCSAAWSDTDCSRRSQDGGAAATKLPEQQQQLEVEGAGAAWPCLAWGRPTRSTSRPWSPTGAGLKTGGARLH